jgi:hypothetical protein
MVLPMPPALRHLTAGARAQVLPGVPLRTVRALTAEAVALTGENDGFVQRRCPSS